VITRRKAESRAAVHVHAVGIPCEREMLVGLLREFARRTAAENRNNLHAAYPQLRVINSVVREVLVTARGQIGRTNGARDQSPRPAKWQKACSGNR
jgi:hypothetical protein